VVVDVFLEGEILSGSKAIDATSLDSGIRFEINGMIPWLVLR
jgi:hypothetical protein